MENYIQEKDHATVNAEKRKSRFFVISWIIFSIIISSFFGAVFGFMSSTVSKSMPLGGLEKFFGNPRVDEFKPEESIKQIVQEDSAVTDVVEKNSPAVVSITVSRNVSNLQGSLDGPMEWFDLFNQGLDPFEDGGNSQNDSGDQKQKIGSGSGFIISADGMIITNKHLISDQAAEYTVITNDSKEHPAKVLAIDPVNDIAIMKIEGQDFHILKLGDSDSLKIGQTVLAIGNSLGEFSNTVSKGIVSGLGRSLTASGGSGQAERLSNIIQTDAAINPGNSGGPLLNMSGEVIGVNVAMAQGAQSIGFTIPVNQIKKVIDQVQKTGKITYPYLGVNYIPIDSIIKQKINFSYDYGALIVRGDTVTDFAVIPGSPADKAGLVENDVILEIDGKKVDKENGLGDMIAKKNVGEAVTLKIWHRGELREATVNLVERPQ